VTVCGWKPASVSVTENSPAACTPSSQGVRQLCPSDVLASAPGGSDSIRSESDDGAGLRKLRLDMVAEHAAKGKPHAAMAMTLRMIGPPPLWRPADRPNIPPP